MDPTVEQWQFREGSEVYDAKGDKIGEIKHVGPDYLLVEKGIIFHTDLYVPRDVVASFDGEKVYLAVAKTDAVLKGWEVKPSDTGASDPALHDAGTMNRSPGV